MSQLSQKGRDGGKEFSHALLEISGTVTPELQYMEGEPQLNPSLSNCGLPTTRGWWHRTAT